ncbi:DUF5677 domain-containing protein [Luteimonas kalidii]|uniref:DUF5677 domain-containing protein n=1 Tax=Luteimonas kalidii TaxID=3042025 RepID=A0ABT6JX87_9GAMM|nr:DUF5677 domain-containing protein [Luteimonas kalidii]MDH5835314.1 DUF5677 domain-containing protein [Luteimonas kalidii]
MLRISVPHPDPVNGRGGCVELMLARHTESLDIACTLATMGEGFIAGLDIHENDPNRLIPACLLIRQISGLRSLCLLAVNGFYTEAIGHQRTLMEALARITALAGKPDLLHDYLAQDVLNTNKLLEDILSFRSDWGPDIPREPPDEELRERIAAGHVWLEGFRNTHGRRARDIKTFDWAQTGGVAHLLFGRFVIASEALHFSPKSLDHLLVTDGDRLEAVRIGPEDEDLDHLILSSCKYVFVGIQTLANILAVTVPDDIDVLYRHFEALYERRADEAARATPNGLPTAVSAHLWAPLSTMCRHPAFPDLPSQR